MGDGHLPLLCKCLICTRVNPEGVILSRERHRYHNRPKQPQSKLDQAIQLQDEDRVICKCSYCLCQGSSGVPFSRAGYLKHVKRAKHKDPIVSLTELQQQAFQTGNSTAQGTYSASKSADDPGTSSFNDLAHVHEKEDLNHLGPEEVDFNDLSPDIHDAGSFPFGEEKLPDDDNQHAMLDNQFIAYLLEMQGILDMHNASETLQDALLSLLFQNSNGSCLASVIAARGTWTGKVNGCYVPTSLKCMKKMHADMGLPSLQRHSVCIHDNDVVYKFKVIEDGSDMNCSCKRDRNGLMVSKSNCIEHETCSICDKTRKDAVTFLYSPISSIMRLRCQSKTIAYNDNEHWRQRETWIGKGIDEKPSKISECWHAKRWREMQYFWDPQTKWELPILCKHCKTVIKTFSPDVHKESVDCNQTYTLTCPQCIRPDTYHRTQCFGDPRNLALMMHWDGFQSTRTTIRSSGVVRLVVLNGGKHVEAKIRDVTFPVLFIPKERISSSTNSLDPFLQPLVDELRDLFVTGVKVNYALGSEYIHAGLPQVFYQRRFLYAITADHPAQCEILKFSSGGKVPCRRCDLVLDAANDGKYYYEDLWRRTRVPDAKKTMDHVLRSIQELHDGVSNAARDTGVRGTSMFLGLFHLYGLNLLHHTIVDVMHTLALNLLRKCNRLMFDQIKEKGNEKVAMERLQTMIGSRTHKMKSGRCPKDPFKRLGFFKAQKHQFYSQWYADYVAPNLVSASHFSISQIATDLTRIFYDFARTNGWSEQTISTARNLLQAWRMQWNALCGRNTSPLEHMIGEGHVLDDIELIGPPDATWCYYFESTFAKLIQMHTNKKEMELTYARVENRILFSRIFHLKSLDNDGLLPPERATMHLQSALRHVHQNVFFTGVLHAKSQPIAIELWESCKRYDIIEWKDFISRKGILIGFHKTRECTPDEARAIQELHSLREVPGGEVSEFKSILIRGSIFRVGDTLVVENKDIEDGQWYGKMRYIFSYKQGDETSVYFAADYYRYHIQDNKVQVDEPSGMPILATSMEPFNHESILPVQHILREICLLPMRAAKDKRLIAFETITTKLPDRLLQMHKCGNVPIWPLVDDVVAIQAIKRGSAPHLASHEGYWYAWINAVNEKDKKIKLTWLEPKIKKGRQCLGISYVENRWQSWDCLLRVLNVMKEGTGKNICFFLVEKHST